MINPCAKFHCDTSTNNKIHGGRGGIGPPSNISTYQKSPIQFGLNCHVYKQTNLLDFGALSTDYLKLITQSILKNQGSHLNLGGINL